MVVGVYPDESVTVRAIEKIGNSVHTVYPYADKNSRKKIYYFNALG